MIFCNRCATYSPKTTLVCPRCQADLAAFGQNPCPVRRRFHRLPLEREAAHELPRLGSMFRTTEVSGIA
jgi:hypothetical protein